MPSRTEKSLSFLVKCLPNFLIRDTDVERNFHSGVPQLRDKLLGRSNRQVKEPLLTNLVSDEL